MANYITSDLHLGHRAILNYCALTRGHLSDVDQMNETIVSNINSVVTEEDTLYILGDIAFMSPFKACEYIKRMNGKKVIVWGNHDHKLRRSTEFASQKGLMGVVWEGDYKEQTFIVDDVKQQIMMMHFPIMEWNGKRHNSFHFFGHRHTSDLRWINGRSCDIGMDTNNLMPYRIDDLISQRIAIERADPACIQLEDYHGSTT